MHQNVDETFIIRILLPPVVASDYLHRSRKYNSVTTIPDDRREELGSIHVNGIKRNKHEKLG